MQPKRSKAYYGLSSDGKVCFQNGMPIRQCQSDTKRILFRGEKIGDQVLSSVEQDKAFSAFLANAPDDPHITLFSSPQTDEDALEAASLLLRNYVAKNWADFLFVNRDDLPPRDPELVKGLYVLMGANHQEPADWIRRWVRSRMGVPIWICLTAPKPVDWYRDSLGLKPDFLFSVKGNAVSAG